MVLLPMYDLGSVNHLLPLHANFNLTCKRNCMLGIFNFILAIVMIIGHVITKVGMDEIYFLSKFILNNIKYVKQEKL